MQKQVFCQIPWKWPSLLPSPREYETERRLLWLKALINLIWTNSIELASSLQVGISLLLETAATAILLHLNWVLVVEGDQWPFKSLIVVYFLRIPTQLLSQIYFIYRSWSLNDKKRILIYFWSFLLFVEVALAIPFGANIANEDRTKDLTGARPGQCEFSESRNVLKSEFSLIILWDKSRFFFSSFLLFAQTSFCPTSS